MLYTHTEPLRSKQHTITKQSCHLSSWDFRREITAEISKQANFLNHHHNKEFSLTWPVHLFTLCVYFFSPSLAREPLSPVLLIGGMYSYFDESQVANCRFTNKAKARSLNFLKFCLLSVPWKQHFMELIKNGTQVNNWNPDCTAPMIRHLEPWQGTSCEQEDKRLCPHIISHHSTEAHGRVTKTRV